MTTGSSASLFAAGTSRRRLLATAAGATAGVAAGAVASPSVAQAASLASGGSAAGRGRDLKVIAVEEAFSVPELIPWPGEARMPPGWGKEWGRRLADLTQLRLADMDEHGIDMPTAARTNSRTKYTEIEEISQ
ncbi:hypothetical protein [Amycolatopsis sp.]|uniref:hypothetical protein n=1 Tax=Amycolatopsis sp. TaxID=37632 RepID=UPI002D805BEC|nr:hypothetical protein [Amycolatopsis sp.]HET6705423.1 hypothetical protein [Amycolatopsis sp.]